MLTVTLSEAEVLVIRGALQDAIKFRESKYRELREGPFQDIGLEEQQPAKVRVYRHVLGMIQKLSEISEPEDH